MKRIVIVMLIICSIINTVHGQLSSTFYNKSCPRALSIVQAAVKQAVAKEKRMGASLLRLHFHDCFVNGCDGLILLDGNSISPDKKTAVPNNNYVGGFDVVDTIKTQVEAACSGAVSCADIVAIDARDSVVAVIINRFYFRFISLLVNTKYFSSYMESNNPFLLVYDCNLIAGKPNMDGTIGKGRLPECKRVQV